MRKSASRAVETGATLAPAARPSPADGSEPSARLPSAAIAARLVADAGEIGRRGQIHIAASENDAEEIARAWRCFDEATEILVLPPWDCLPYDRVPPSREAMGRRMLVLDRLASRPDRPLLLVASIEALLQRLPPIAALEGAFFDLAVGVPFDREALRSFAARTGYVLDDRVDEAGEIAFLGDVVDIFPAAAAQPVRIVLAADGTVADIRPYDPVSQRTEDTIDRIRIGPASELVLHDAEPQPIDTPVRMESRLIAAYETMPTVFSLMPEARITCAGDVQERLDGALDLIDDALQARRTFGDGGATGAGLYLDRGAWTDATAEREPETLALQDLAAIPRFWLDPNPARSFARFVEDRLAAGTRIAVTGVGTELERVLRRLRRTLQRDPAEVSDWRAICAAEPGALMAAAFDLSRGFEDKAASLTVIPAADIFGARVFDGDPAAGDLSVSEPELRVGDVVIHEDHGIGVLRALETVELDGTARDAVRLEYHGGASLLVPIEEFDRLWRYGSEEDAVKLDRLNTDGWYKRRAEISAEIDAAARHLVELASAREEQQAQVITAPRAAYARFIARFPYPETPDQAAAIAAVLQDLQSGKPMNRLICGDVGFGKTEIALRAAAAVALSGKQVAVIAPTTVLARQHFELFQRRFSGTGVEVGHLSRVTAGAEADAVKAGLASGATRIVVGTQAIVSGDVEFSDLALLVIDEEHRFGAAMKQSMRDLAPDLHALTMSATPIPRTLQSAMVGCQEVSVLASPPARRRPVRTFMTPFDAASVRTALVREKRRGGQSFFVVPRIEDLEIAQRELGAIAPEFDLRVAHGKLDAKTMDEIMVGFADGSGDVLLATNIIESGLDVPRANTMFVWRADRFGLAQLHQLRGRVGRGRVQGVAYLLTDPESEIAAETRSRLSTLVAHDRLGSGLAISARDLDLRGAGDLVGDEQAGHVRLIGVSLYQRLLAQAVAAKRGEKADAVWQPEINLGIAGTIPAAYVPEAAVRLNLYARLLRMGTAAEIDAFADELDDRFGTPAEEVTLLLDLARLKLSARDLNIARIDAGPLAIAVSFRRTPGDKVWKRLLARTGLKRREDRLIAPQEAESGGAALPAVQELLAHIGAVSGQQGGSAASR